LQNDIKDQEQELARLGARQLSLKDIDAKVKDLEADAEEAQQKRDELKKSGKLDPDLRIVIDKIIKDLKKMRGKVDNLMALDEKAKARKEEVERKAKEAEEEARKQAKKEGKNPDEAAAEAAKRVRAEGDKESQEAEFETLKAAQEVKGDLDEAEGAAKELDTGLHPHGSKWWRYRYEHSYIEALLMIFISFLMLFWSRVMHNLRHYVKVWALPADAAPMTPVEEMDEEVHGTFYVLWLKLFAEQMMVCTLVFLTVWVLAKTKMIDLFVLVVKPTEDMHVPHTGEEYRQLAVDICTIFFFAIFCYFSLMLAVAHDTRDLTRALENVDKGSEFAHLATAPSSQMGAAPSLSGARARASGVVMGALPRSNSGFVRTQNHFVNKMRDEMLTRQDPVMKEICTLLNNDINVFPLYKYLILNVRMTAAQLLEFSWTMWLPVVASFMCFALLHRFAHIGYVRIMIGFALLVLFIIVGMAWYTKHMGKMLREDDPPETPKGQQSNNQSMIKASMILCAFQFAVFFLCYGVARMICQPWMWNLHFWTVLCLTVVAFIKVILFVTLISPAIPSFCAVMALPPNVDSDNLAVMLHVARGVKLTSMGS